MPERSILPPPHRGGGSARNRLRHLGLCVAGGDGAKVGKGEAPVVCIAGDGGFQFSLQELASGREIDVPVIVVLWNNGGHGEIRSYMVSNGIKPVGVDLFTPDFQIMAQAFDCHATTATSPETLANALLVAVGRDRPTIIEIGEGEYLSGRA